MYGTEWPILCWCAVKKLLTHSLDWKCLNQQPRSPLTLPGVSTNPDEGDPASRSVSIVVLRAYAFECRVYRTLKI